MFTYRVVTFQTHLRLFLHILMLRHRLVELLRNELIDAGLLLIVELLSCQLPTSLLHSPVRRGLMLRKHPIESL